MLITMRNGHEEMFYISRKIGPKLMQFLKKRILCKQTDLYPGTYAFLHNEKNLYASVEKLFKDSKFYAEVFSILNVFNLETEKLITSLKKYLVPFLSNDIKILTLAQESFKNAEDTGVIVNNYGLLKETAAEIIKTNKIFSSVYFIKGIILFFVTVLLFLKKILFQKKKKELNNFTGIKIIFEQMYKGQEGNPEFDAFYRYFKERNDILYICISNDSKIYNILKADNKPVLLKNNIPLLQQNRLIYLKYFIKLFFLLIFSTKLKSVYVKTLILKMFYNKIHYEVLFKKYRPSFYLKIRSDTDPSHPIATAVADKYSVKHIGYQHGPYRFMAIFAHIDFHIYGLLGGLFLRETYSQIWPKKIQYAVSGPITVESNVNNDKVRIKKDEKFVVGVFTNVADDNNQYWHLLHKRFLEILCHKLSDLHVPNLYLIFKEKSYSIYSEKLIVDLCRNYSLSYEIAYHLHPVNVSSNYSNSVIDKFNVLGINAHLNPSNIRVSCTSIQVIDLSNVVVEISPHGCSSVTFEALGKKKKMLIFATKYFQNPLGKLIPELIVRNKNEFELGMKFLMNISQPEYEEYIQPAIENCCKVSDGNLVRDFISSIANCVKDNSNKECIGSSR